MPLPPGSRDGVVFDAEKRADASLAFAGLRSSERNGLKMLFSL